MSGNSQPASSKDGPQKSYIPVGLSPQQIVAAYNAGQWEEFIQEWVQGLEKKYNTVQRFSGPGDKGRDVVGFVEAADFGKPWDNYQCKHYDSPLAPTNIWLELGKLVYFTFIGDFTVPRCFRFVAPRDVGPKLKDLLANPKSIAAGLIENWQKYCEKGITDTKTVSLDPALTKHIRAFDFSIVGYSPVLEIIQDHMKTPFWATRFKTEVPPRPPNLEPPAEIARNEMSYVNKLLEAYGDAQQQKFTKIDDIASIQRFANHFKRSRQWFFMAETLNRFSRDHYPPRAFEDLKQQVFDGIVDTCDKDHAHGFECVCAVTDKAADLVLGNSDLAPQAGVGDKKGICHHLANEDKVKWVKQ